VIGIFLWPSEYTARFQFFHLSIAVRPLFCLRLFVRAKVCGMVGMAQYWAVDCTLRRSVSVVTGMGSCLKTQYQKIPAFCRRTVYFLTSIDISWCGLHQRRPAVIVGWCGPFAVSV